jgi:hypothetical protein
MSIVGFPVYLIAPTIKLDAKGFPPANLIKTPSWAVLVVGDKECLAVFTTKDAAAEFVNRSCLHGYCVHGLSRADLARELRGLDKRVEMAVLDPSLDGPCLNRMPLSQILAS